MNTRTQNIISLSTNSAVIIGSLAISSYAYSIAPQLSPFSPVSRVGIAIALGVGVKFFRAYPYYLSTLITPAPGAWRWVLVGLAFEGFDLAVLGYLFKVKLSIDSALSAIVSLWGYSGSWAVVSLLHDLGLRPVRRKRFYSRWFAAKSRPSDISGDVSVIDDGNPPIAIDFSSPQPKPNRTDSEFVSQLIPKIASLFVVGLSGSGKDFTTSVLARSMKERFGCRIFYIDPKHSETETMWDAVADYKYQFKGTMMDADEYLTHLKTAMNAYQTQLDQNGDSFYTILVLNELATCATKTASSKDKTFLASTLQPMISGLDSAGGCVWVLTQTTSMPAGFNNGIVSQFQKLIITRQEQIENLKTQSQNTLMKGVDLEPAIGCCRDSEIDRAIYSSATMSWLPLPALRKGLSYYDRDSRSWRGVAANTSPNNAQNRDVEDVDTRKHQRLSDSVSTSTADVSADVLAYFRAASTNAPRTIRDVRMGNRVRKSGASAADVQAAIDNLVFDGFLSLRDGGYVATNTELN